jgi:hypothetical protein
MFEKSIQTLEFERLSSAKHIAYKQRNFWIYTTKRFFTLYDFLKYSKIEKCLHLESDNIIIDRYGLNWVLENASGGLAYPVQSNTEACGSFVVISKLQELEKFLDFVLSKWSDPNCTDMTLLRDYMDLGEVHQIDSAVNSQVIVDPGAYGKFFCGSDARNFRLPFSYRGIVSQEPNNLLNSMNALKFRVASREPRLTLDDPTRGRVVSLHLHAKVVPRTLFQLNRMLKKSFLTRGILWRYGSLDLVVIIERLISKVYRVLGKKTDFRLR